MKKKKKAYVFLNGELRGSIKYYQNLISIKEDHIFCADGGAFHLEKLNIIPDELWGDLDSISPKLLDFYRENKVKIQEFPIDKNNTDGELLIKYLSKIENNYEKVQIIGGLGGRTDHFLSNLNWLFMYPNLSFISEDEVIFKVENDQSFSDFVGNTASFVPYSHIVENVTLEGFKYPLDNYTILRGDSICMSNIVLSPKSSIKFTNGQLICIINKNEL